MVTCSQAGHPKPSLHAAVPLGAERGVLSRDIKQNSHQGPVASGFRL